jgi:hypothetical protein
MFIIFKDSVVDCDLLLLAEVLGPVDKHLGRIMSEYRADPEMDVDSHGYIDRAEHVTGLGFVASQTYLAATAAFLNIPKRRALAAGPTHKSGRAIADVVNHAANYWKHHDEWSPETFDARQKRIAEAFNDLGFSVDGSYPLCGLLNGLTGPTARFGPFVDHFVLWRDDLRRSAG